MGEDWGQSRRGEVYVDSSATLGVVRRKGCGKTRHIKVGQLWIQQKEEDGELKYNKTAGEKNVADLWAKYLKEDKIAKFMRDIGFEDREGRAESSLQTA